MHTTTDRGNRERIREIVRRELSKRMDWYDDLYTAKPRRRPRPDRHKDKRR